MITKNMFQNIKLVILYGSQTGNAQDLAENIWRESKRYYFKSTVKSMDDYNVLELINENCVIFVCSTTGQGEEPDNMKTFWRFLLRKNLPPDSLSNLKYCVLGLGDSSYTKFNFAAKRLYKRLQQLGGQPLLPIGLADDQHDLGYDGIADPWIDSMWTKLLSIYPLPNNVQPLEKNREILPRWNVQLLNNHQSVSPRQSLYYSTRQPDDFKATVLENVRITSKDHFQDVRFIRLGTDGQKYAPGDIVALRPKNLQWQIEEFKNVLQSNGLDFSRNFQLTPNDPDLPIPPVLQQNLDFDQLCEEYFDLMAIPRRYTFQLLAQLTDSELEKEKCLEFITAEGQEDLFSYCNRQRRNIVEVLQDFPHATKNLTRETLFEIMPPIKAREFSIASNFNMHQNEIHILLAVVKYKTKLIKERFGLCSNYLAELKEGDSVTAWLRKGSFRFPNNSDVPVIMVGPGTGLAPFRNFIFGRVKDGSASSDNMLLFFGCRHPDKDFHYKDELLALHNENKLNLVTAFSRVSEDKIYVQHKIEEHQDVVWQILNNNGYIFIAGSAKFMPQQVREAFVNVCQNAGGLTKENAEKFIEVMEKQNRYQTECWS